MSRQTCRLATYEAQQHISQIDVLTDSGYNAALMRP
jgi:hypothetical protein